MRVLMLGWDFSPRLSGGVGSACQGLANALARAPEPLRTEVLFVLPRLRGDEEPENVRLLAGDRASSGADAAELARAPERTEPTEIAEPPRSEAPTRIVTTPVVTRSPRTASAEEAPAAALPSLPSPAEALRLLAIDSPLQPYLSPADYSAIVRALLDRIRRTPPEPAPQPARRVESAPHPAGARRSAGERSVRAAPAAPKEELRAEPAAAVPVPPYGHTLLAEVERYARAALALAQRESFDVIHAHDWMTFPAGLLLQEHTGKPLVVHFHSSEAERRGPLAARDVRAVEQAALDAAERVLCVSEASARTLRAHHGVEYAKMRVLHNAYAPLEAVTSEPERGDPVVLYLGRLSEQKSPDVFLRAAALVHERHPRARFVLAGEGELYPELVELARELELTPHVTFTGFVAGEELARTYAGADVYVLSSTSEPFGISALEALSLGVPTIVPHGSGVTEVVRSVLRFEPGDVGELADKIVSLLVRPALRKQLSAAGLREVKKLRWERPARALRGIYDELVTAAT